jgi:hypothetical protein
MSRAYRIAVSETLRRHVTVKDGVQTTLELLAILPEEAMCELLAAQLEELGFERDAPSEQGPEGRRGGSMHRVDDDGMEVTVDLKQGTVTARLAADHEIAISRKASGAIGDRAKVQQAKAALSTKVQGQLERQADKDTEKLRQQLTGRLEQKLRDLQLELDGAVNRATAAALKEKAASLGEIEEISEDEETGALTIKVRL